MTAFKANYENFFDLNVGKNGVTYAWIGNDALHELECCSLSPYNETPMFVCHECGFIFDGSWLGFEEHEVFHAKRQR